MSGSRVDPASMNNPIAIPMKPVSWSFILPTLSTKNILVIKPNIRKRSTKTAPLSENKVVLIVE